MVFGAYNFPLTCQVKTDSQKIGLDQKRVPFNFGDQIPLNTNFAAKEVNIVGLVGSGLVGSSGATIVSANDLEAERVKLQGLANQGHTFLFTRWDRFRLAFLSELQCNPEQDYGEWRYATFDAKFICDDPRAYGITQHSETGSVSGSTPFSFTATHGGNIVAFPQITITGLGMTDAAAGNGPIIGMEVGGNVQQIAFSTLALKGGDTLVINCDPRPENRCIAAVYTPSGGSPQNAMGFVRPTDYTQEIDFTEFFPFIPPGAGCTFYVSCTSGGNFDVTVDYLDTFI